MDIISSIMTFYGAKLPFKYCVVVGLAFVLKFTIADIPMRKLPMIIFPV